MNTSSDVALRYATLHDIPALVALVTSAYRGDASRAGWTTEADILDGARIGPDVLRADLERPRSKIVLLEQAGNLLACAHAVSYTHLDVYKRQVMTRSLPCAMPSNWRSRKRCAVLTLAPARRAGR